MLDLRAQNEVLGWKGEVRMYMSKAREVSFGLALVSQHYAA